VPVKIKSPGASATDRDSMPTSSGTDHNRHREDKVDHGRLNRR
jgi:hypothetical protein